jgi:pSer/pThr/pTyr-binding forkhead associated (FHA) protein
MAEGRAGAPVGILEVVAGPAKGTRISLDAGPLELGRSATGEGTLGDDPELSRRHARLERLEDGSLRVEDLGSTHGTLVNGARIDAPSELRVGDELEVGATKLKVVPAPMARPALRVVAGFAPGAVVHVGEGLTLGRAGPGARALGSDPDVADDHAQVSPTGDGRLLVEDLGSASGTIVGGGRIQAPTILATGERLQLGGTTLEVVEAAEAAAGTVRAVGGRVGGVQQVPEGLFARIGMRAPVTLQDVLPVFLLSLGWALAANLLIRSLAIEALDVDEDLHSLVLVPLLLGTLFPVAGNSLGFYMTFRRPNDRSVTRYLIPTLALPVVFIVINLVTLNTHGPKDVAVTIVVTVLPAVISAPLMFRMRARVARERVGVVRGDRR